MAEPRVLIANRGEIAVRVIRTCRELDIPTVAVYSDVDREALHVETADDAYRLGPATPAESYLNIERILEAAKRSRANLVHPGYGFLAENGDFAQAVEEAGLTFIGPPAAAIRLMGDKIAARRAAMESGAPVAPGTSGPVDVDQALLESVRIGYPMIAKAAFGGGGKGMHLVHREEQLTEALERSAREAKAYFGRPEVFLERYIVKAHHVEAQILADRHGNVSFLGERDCSLQRRHQKLVEESPSPIVGDELRTRIGEAAVGIARAAGYVNAGTVEFLVDDDGRFYFMEMNTRLQVEHPVTEFVAGLDLVRLQLMVALGERVSVEPSLRGHAIECRLNAEDPYRDFMPGPGLLTTFRPPGGPFVRLDSGFTEGRRIPGDYDPLFAKLIVWAEDRELARHRMLRALDETRVEGVPTTIPFHRWVLDTEEFRTAAVHTRWVEQALAEAPLKAPGEIAEPPGDGSGPTPGPTRPPLHLVAEVDGHRIPVLLWGETGQRPPKPPPVSSGGGAHGAGDTIVAPMQGTILNVMVEEGQDIKAGDIVCILEAMKMENHIAATRDGKVSEVSVQKGAIVETGQPLISIE